jgi:hypothetical protein
MIYREIENCRFDGSTKLTTVLELGTQVLTGVFPRPNEEVEAGPLELVFAHDSCLLQLRHTYAPEKMYGMNYGYRSALNQSMVNHLVDKAHYLEAMVNLKDTDVVLDIGSNDSTFLKAYETNCTKIGIDPTGIKFSKYYPENVTLVSDFFTKTNYESVEKRKAKIITSIAMFYDLEKISPFVADIADCLDNEGIWHFEQSYMPSMIRTMAYDTVCHEHTEYYSMLSVTKILEKFDMEIADVVTNNINGGSFAVTAVHKSNKTVKRNKAVVDWMLEKEYTEGYHTLTPYLAFAEKVENHRRQLLKLIHSLKAEGKSIYGYGASTKGNVLLQYCGLTSNEITAIAEVNEDKFGCVTPGTNIPIISETEARAAKPDYFLVLPWHFRDGIVRREQEFLKSGGHFIFPCPEIEIV